MKVLKKIILCILILALLCAEGFAFYYVITKQKEGFEKIDKKLGNIEKKIEELDLEDMEEEKGKDKDKLANEDEIDKIRKVDIADLNHSSSAKDLLNGILSSNKLSEDFKDFLTKFNKFKEIKKEDKDKNENLKKYFETEFDFEEVYISESFISAHTYLTAVIKVKDEREAEKIEEKIENNIKKSMLFIESKPEEIEVEKNGKLILVSAGNKKDVEQIEDLFEKVKK